MDTVLFDAARAGDLSRVTELLKTNVYTFWEITDALRLASFNGHLTLVELLIQNGAGIHTFDNHSLQCACSSGHVNVVKYLMKHGAIFDPKWRMPANIRQICLEYPRPKYPPKLSAEEIDYISLCKMTDTLFFAVEKGDLDAVKHAVENGAYVCACDNKALRNAASAGHLAIVEYLIKSGANISGETFDPEVTFTSSSRDQLEKTYRRLSPYESLFLIQSPLACACEKGNLDVIKYLLAAGAQDLEVFSNACSEGQLDVVECLLENGVRGDAYDYDALGHVGGLDNLNDVKRLLRAGANVNYVFQIVCKIGHLNIVKYMVENGANVRANGDRALRLASKYKHMDVVKFLLKHGAFFHLDWTGIPKEIRNYCIGQM